MNWVESSVLWWIVEPIQVLFPSSIWCWVLIHLSKTQDRIWNYAKLWVRETNDFFTWKRGKRRKTVAKCAVHKDENCFLLYPTWAQDVCVKREMCHCQVYCIRLWCDHCTTHNTGSTSASSRREAVSDSRGVPRCTEKNFKIYACSHVLIVRLDQSTIHVSRDVHWPLYHVQVSSSQSALFPCQASISICRIVHVPVLSFQCQ